MRFVLRRLFVAIPAAIAFGAATVLLKMPIRDGEALLLGEEATKIEVAFLRMARLALEAAPDTAPALLARGTGFAPAEVRLALEGIADGSALLAARTVAPGVAAGVAAGDAPGDAGGDAAAARAAAMDRPAGDRPAMDGPATEGPTGPDVRIAGARFVRPPAP
ncbi:hypothetical protein BCF33_2580 [Hasllibacter halocynthiae]|uniref:Uncharacterized protein n=1 Tax=Hasllibacter halocynthiae TaxID=595589 RepID=A0A2T0X427_9RHOB|nr:hypothetical protein [Hasllibacter halocynthiae]PRY93698.1 hypothetical protein BCF33_2580 [Hasllibacter halocynthiae]